MSHLEYTRKWEALCTYKTFNENHTEQKQQNQRYNVQDRKAVHWLVRRKSHRHCSHWSQSFLETECQSRQSEQPGFCTDILRAIEENHTVSRYSEWNTGHPSGRELYISGILLRQRFHSCIRERRNYPRILRQEDQKRTVQKQYRRKHQCGFEWISQYHPQVLSWCIH